MGLFSAGPPQPFTYHRGHTVVDGLAIADVGVRKKGFFGSIDSVRPSLIVDFNRYVPQQPIDGIGRLTLNNNKQDTSCVGQYLAYFLFRAAGVPAARAGFASVTVNGEGLGIYTLVEPIKKPFLARAFGDSAGSLYEGTVADLVPESLGKLEVETHDRARPQLEEPAHDQVAAGEGRLVDEVHLHRGEVAVDSVFRGGVEVELQQVVRVATEVEPRESVDYCPDGSLCVGRVDVGQREVGRRGVMEGQRLAAGIMHQVGRDNVDRALHRSCGRRRGGHRTPRGDDRGKAAGRSDDAVGGGHAVAKGE